MEESHDGGKKVNLGRIPKPYKGGIKYTLFVRAWEIWGKEGKSRGGVVRENSYHREEPRVNQDRT